MPTFVLTARHDINRGQMHIGRGQQFQINVNMMGVGPNNLFNNGRCHDALKAQLEKEGIYLSERDMRGGKGMFDIKKF